MLSVARATERLEIVPIGGVVEEVTRRVPRTAAVSITALPQHDPARTISVARTLASEGYVTIPHLPANRIRGLPHLADILDELAADGVRSVFAIGGDGERRDGCFADGGALLEGIRLLRGDAVTVGAATYPEAHPQMDPARVLQVVAAKARSADYLVTQMCFEAPVVVSHLRALRDAEVSIPVWVGVAGPVRLGKLLAVASRIGLGSSLSFAFKGGNRRLVGRYAPDALTAEIIRWAREAEARPAGFHWYTFNDLQAVAAPHPDGA